MCFCWSHHVWLAKHRLPQRLHVGVVAAQHVVHFHAIVLVQPLGVLQAAVMAVRRLAGFGLVVLDHATGQVRAMASYPTYDPAELVGGISCPTWRDLQGLPAEGECGDEMTDEIKALKKADDAPVAKLLNRAYQGAYQPASTFKLASAYAALKDGVRTKDAVTQDNGVIFLCGGTRDDSGCRKQNAGQTPHGPVSLSPALTVSSDIYFYEVGRDFWARAKSGSLGETAFQDGVGELDVPVTIAGVVFTPGRHVWADEDGVLVER